MSQSKRDASSDERSPALAHRINCPPKEERLTKVQQVVERPILELMDEIKSKLKLLDGESKSLYENSYEYLQYAKDRIYQLQETNKGLRKRLADSGTIGESVLEEALQKMPHQRPTNLTLSTDRILQLFDDQVAQRVNNLNLLRYRSHVKTDRLQALETEIHRLDELVKEKDGLDRTATGRRKQDIRLLENKIEKAMIKKQEMEHIAETYTAIRDRFDEEGRTYTQTLRVLKSEIERCADRLDELYLVHQEALLIRDKTATELQRHEELYYAHRKRRELELVNLRHLLEKKRESTVQQKSLVVGPSQGCPVLRRRKEMAFTEQQSHHELNGAGHD